MDEQTPLERAARALMLHHDCDPDVFIGMHGGYGHWLGAARAVLMAIREPSPEMVLVGLFTQTNPLTDSPFDTYQAMIDVALGE